MALRGDGKEKPLKKTEKDVIYNTDGAPKVKEPGMRWRWEPFRIGTDG
jgi:hypothetical protein